MNFSAGTFGRITTLAGDPRIIQFGDQVRFLDMTTLNRFLLALAVAAMFAPPLAAHHGRGRTFDMKNRVTLKGVVSQVKWQNPHVLIFIDVKDDDRQGGDLGL